ncbi:isoprenylcysteine carboxylmethyltransferase family protein [bacterium]|nr:isoprenylcysteine carboxylmethyltransferase family protein [bacterium]
MNSKIVSIIAFILGVSALATLVIRQGVFSPSPVVILLQALAILLMLWARITFGRRSFHFAANPTSGELITSGPYHYIRHPVYAAIVIFTVAGVAANLSISNSILGLIVVSGMIVRALCEEQLLHSQYPEYTEYSKHTWRLIPFLF